MHGINSNHLSLLRSHYTVRNKDDLDSFIKTNTYILALNSYLNNLYSVRYNDFFIQTDNSNL